MFKKMLNVGLLGMTALTIMKAHSTVQELERLNDKLQLVSATVPYRVDTITVFAKQDDFNQELRDMADRYYTF